MSTNPTPTPPPVPPSQQTSFPFMPPDQPSPYETAPVYVTGPNNYKQGPLNPVYWATEDAATWLSERYQALAVLEVPGLTPGSPYQYTEPMRVLLYPGGQVVAGLLAQRFLSFSTAFAEADTLNWASVQALQQPGV